MYEYAPKPKKTKEKLIFALSLVLAAACFGVSHIPAVPYPAVYQLLMVFCLVGTVMILVRCLMRNYVYRVEPRENAAPDEPPDFTVTEVYGNRRSVVCRISAGEVRRIERVTRENRSALSTAQKRKRVYYYTAQLQPSNLWVLAVEEEGEEFFVRICADEGLIQILNRYAKQ